MKTLSIRVLYFALIAIWFTQAACVEQEGVSSLTAAPPKSHYGGFSSHPDSLQIFYDYIHGQEMMKVEAGVSPWPWQGRTPSFFRLVWDPDKAMWRHVEAYFSGGVPQDFLFNFI